MTTSYTSKKLTFNTAEQFKESFSEFTPTVGYVFIGNHLPYSNEDVADSISDTVYDEKTIWDNIYAAKRVSGNDVELVAPRYNWAANTAYNNYDDKISLEFLTQTEYANAKAMYVMNSERNVYLCIDNNLNANSTVEPTGKNLSSNGNIATADGYIWKYLYNVRASNKFITEDWIPVPTSVSKLDYDTSSLISVDGELAYIEVVNTGSGYVHTNVSATSFTSGTNIITVANTTNIALNMAVSGTGIPADSHITNIDTLNLRLTLSSNTSANGGGTGNTISITTRVVVDGDGLGAIPTLRLNANTGVQKIILTTYGRGYTRSNVTIYGTGTGAVARAVLPPKFGHGFNAAKQLNATNVMVSMKIGEIDSTENGIISTDTSFRQYGLLRDPYKYGATTTANTNSANSVISQTTDLTIISGPSYNTDEFVYQGETANTATFSGFVNAQSANVVRLTRVRGTPVVGGALKGLSTNPTGRAVVIARNPEFQPYTGDVMYVENITKVERTDGQAESIKFVVRF
jgi:hypothetical protein